MSSQENLFVTIKRSSGAPVTFKIHWDSLRRSIQGSVFTLVALLILSLLFFRELELNRKLQDTVLDYKTREQIQKLDAIRPIAPVATMSEVQNTAATATTPTPQETRMENTATQTPETPAETSYAQAKLSDIWIDCLKTKCSIEVGMVPTSTGITSGQLLLALETEVLRIGAANPSQAERKRFFYYPASEATDTLETDKLTQLPKKAFRFSKALRTSTDFQLESGFKATRLHIYLFGEDGELTHHEQRPIETQGGSDAP